MPQDTRQLIDVTLPPFFHPACSKGVAKRVWGAAHILDVAPLAQPVHNLLQPAYGHGEIVPTQEHLTHIRR